ncbi:MAG: ABC transporter permease [Chthonomonadales bacterium]
MHSNITHPLSPWIYFRRNPGKTLPIVFVIAVAVALVASVVTVVDSINLTVLTMYGYQRHFAVITPRNALAVPDEILAQVRRQPLLDRVYPAQAAFTEVKTIFGKVPFVIFGLEPAARDTVLARCGLKVIAGRLPAEGAPEVALSVDIVRNRKLHLGSVVLSPQSEGSYCIVPARLVGILDGPVWFALTSQSFVRAHFPLAPEGVLVLARDERNQRRLDTSLGRVLDKARCRLWTYAGLVRDTRDALASLYLIMGVVIGIIVFAIAFLTAMLTSIYFTQRLSEFATLSAIGYARRVLMLRVLAEVAMLCVFGWAFGAVLTVAGLAAIKHILMTPRGLLLDVWDPHAYRFTVPMPLAILTFALAGIGHRMMALDPVAIIERRQ